jgi:DNA-binding NarL/FixJ family response regulator
MSHSEFSIRVLVVDDHPLMREALVAALEGEPDLLVAGAANNGVQALQSFRNLRPDVVIMDLMMPVRDGVAATRDILAEDPNARVLVLTSAVGDERLVQALTAGALGYLLKDAEREEILEGVRKVAQGELFLPAQAAGKLVRAIQQGGPGTASAGTVPAGTVSAGMMPGAMMSGAMMSGDMTHLPLAEEGTPLLSPRQLDVLALAAEGLSDAEIAARLVLSESTVRVHFHHIIEKLGAADRAAALAWYARQRGA